MKVLIAGSNGYIGQHVTQLFREQGFDVYLYRREGSNFQETSHSIPSNCVDMQGCFDVVINCARAHWSTHNPSQIADIERSLLTHLDNLASENAIKIHTSGVWLFGKANEHEMKTFTLRPFNMVKRDKQTIQDLLDKNWNVVYCPSIVYGGQSCQLKRIIDEWTDSSVTVATPSIGYNQYIHVCDVARFYLLLATQTNMSLRQHFIAETEGYSPEKFAELLLKNSAINHIIKVNWNEFEAKNNQQAIEFEKLNTQLTISPLFTQNFTIKNYF